MKCTNCGREYDNDVNFCSNCGAILNNSNTILSNDNDTNLEDTIIISENQISDINNNNNKENKGIDKDFYGNDFKENKNNKWIILIIIVIFISIIFWVIY